MLSATPVSVTVWVLFQLLAVKVSVPGLTVPSSVAPLVTATVTLAVGRLASLTVKVSTPPSVTVVAPPLWTTISPTVSSSMVVTLTVSSGTVMSLL